jgi:hypothetical protein
MNRGANEKVLQMFDIYRERLEKKEWFEMLILIILEWQVNSNNCQNKIIYKALFHVKFIIMIRIELYEIECNICHEREEE